MDVDADSAKVTFPPPFIFLGFLLIGVAMDRLLSWSLGLTALTRAALAVPLVVGGAMLALAARGLFVRAGTDVKPWKTASAIVDTGVYAHSRNPMYIGMALIHAGLAIAFGGPGTLLLLVIVLAIIRTQVIAREEAYLEGKFGDAYRAYKARVRRWL